MPVTFYNGALTLTAEAALSAATGSYGAWNAGLWDTATWGPDTDWQDISDYVRSVATNRHFSRDLQAWEAGTATIVLDNRDGRFSPDNLSGPYVTGGVTSIRPWRPMRVRVAYGGTTYHLYRGYALSWDESWTLAATNSGDAITTVPCTDELAALARFDGLEMSPAGAGEYSGARIHRVLNNAGHSGERNIAVGVNTMQATTLAANAVSELKLTADSEGGALWVEADGTVTFADQHALLESSRSNTVQATFGDGGGSELPYSAITTNYSGDQIVNIASWAREGSTEQTVTDETSRALYQDKRSTRTDLICETDAQALILASIEVARYKDPERRVTAITVKPRRDPATLFPEVLSRRVRDLIRVKRRPPGSFTITSDNFIAGIRHQFTPSDWSTTYELWSATPYAQYGTPLWGSAIWDTSKWFF